MLEILRNYPSAYKKLSIIACGIDADGDELARSIADYPMAFKTKRAKKLTCLIGGKMFDKGDENSPYVPQELILFFDTGRQSVVKFNYRPSSPIKLVFSDDKKELKLWHSEENWTLPVKIPRRVPSNEYVSVLGIDRLGIMGYQGCSGWLQKRQCLFCDNVALRQGEKSLIPNLNDLPDLNKNTIENWLEKLTSEYADRIAQSCARLIPAIQPHCHVVFMSGNLPYIDLIWKYHLDLIQKVTEKFSLDDYDTYLNILPPEGSDSLKKAKALGIKKVVFNMEVWGDDYKVVCREKNALLPMPEFMQRLKESVDIFGKGNVYCGFVLGAQNVERLYEGCDILTKMGVSCNMTVFTPKPGTPWENKKTLPLTQVAEFSLYLSKKLRQNNLSPLYCRLSSRSEVIWEIMEDMADEQ